MQIVESARGKQEFLQGVGKNPIAEQRFISSY